MREIEAEIHSAKLSFDDGPLAILTWEESMSAHVFAGVAARKMLKLCCEAVRAGRYDLVCPDLSGVEFFNALTGVSFLRRSGL